VTPQALAQAEKVKAMAANMISKAWSAGDLDVIDSHTTKDFTCYDPLAPTGMSKAEYREQVRLFRSAFPDLTTEIKGQWAEGNTVVTKFQTTGTFSGSNWGDAAPNGARITIDGVELDHVEPSSGKISTTEQYYDSEPLSRAVGLPY
jgi:predicted ester cyclase